MVDPKDELSPIVIASQWATRIMAVAGEMVLPGLLGLWVDTRLGTRVVFMLIGFGLGSTLAVWHLVKMTSQPRGEQRPPIPDEKRGKRGP
ncbi:MAG: AtpZ/AtpI family protein [Planctomycetia bacterium]|nr:AtpZ/AtpI family protein [Planctomycetia bacterium]